MRAAILALVCAPCFALDCVPPQYGPAGAPGVGVPGTFTEVTGDGWGYAVAWLCPGGGPRFVANSVVGLHAVRASPSLTSLALGAMGSPPGDLLATANAMLSQLTSIPTEGTTARAAYDRLHATAQSKAWALAPVPKWAVAVNGAYKTRQWYAYTNGVRATAGGGSVDVGLACDLAKVRVDEDLRTYAAFAPTYRPDRVTLCEPK